MDQVRPSEQVVRSGPTQEFPAFEHEPKREMDDAVFEILIPLVREGAAHSSAQIDVEQAVLVFRIDFRKGEREQGGVAPGSPSPEQRAQYFKSDNHSESAAS